MDWVCENNQAEPKVKDEYMSTVLSFLLDKKLYNHLNVELT